MVAGYNQWFAFMKGEMWCSDRSVVALVATCLSFLCVFYCLRLHD